MSLSKENGGWRWFSFLSTIFFFSLIPIAFGEPERVFPIDNPLIIDKLEIEGNHGHPYLEKFSVSLVSASGCYNLYFRDYSSRQEGCFLASGTIDLYTQRRIILELNDCVGRARKRENFSDGRPKGYQEAGLTIDATLTFSAGLQKREGVEMTYEWWKFRDFLVNCTFISGFHRFTCSNCNGSGHVPALGEKWADCGYCRGKGCDRCNGLGRVKNTYDFPDCPSCQGKQFVDKVDKPDPWPWWLAH